MRTLKQFGDEASAALSAWLIVILGVSTFLWIALSVVIDRLGTFQNSFAASTGFIPVSSDRVQVTQWMQMGWASFILLGILLPIIFFVIIRAKSRVDTQL